MLTRLTSFIKIPNTGKRASSYKKILKTKPYSQGNIDALHKNVQI